MTARTGMATLINQTRMYAEAGTADYTLVRTGGTITYWGDDEIQDVLERCRKDIYREPLLKIPTHIAGGSIEWTLYQSRYTLMEQTLSGTANFVLRNSAGSIIGTALYSVDYQRGLITFAADTGGSTYFLTARSYNLQKAAADIWRMKASHVADRYDLQTGEIGLDRSQLMKHYIKMADMYDGEGGPETVKMHRSDAV